MGEEMLHEWILYRSATFMRTISVETYVLNLRIYLTRMANLHQANVSSIPKAILTRPPHTIPFLERYTWTNSRPPPLSIPQARKKRSNRNQIKTNRNFDNFSISIWLQFPHFIWANSQPKFALGSFSSFVWLNHMLMQTTWTFSFAWVYFLIFCYTRDEAIIRNDLCIGTRWFARLLNPQCCRWLKIFCLIFLGNTAV